MPSGTTRRPVKVTGCWPGTLRMTTSAEAAPNLNFVKFHTLSGFEWFPTVKQPRSPANKEFVSFSGVA
jgi:hypothetical protein